MSSPPGQSEKEEPIKQQQEVLGEDQHEGMEDDSDIIAFGGTTPVVPSESETNKNASSSSGTTATVTPPALPLDWTQLGAPNLFTNNNSNTTSNGTPLPGEAAAAADVDPHPIRYPSDVMELSNDPEETYLEIIGTAGQKITHMGKDLYRQCSPNLTHLIFRSHLITKMEGFEMFRKLELLELYDNSVEALDGLGPTKINHGLRRRQQQKDEEEEDENWTCVGENLKILDMSYNAIRDMSPVIHCKNLTELYLANNKIKSISGLQHLTNLRKLDLGANRIRKMSNEDDDESSPPPLSYLTNLEELWIGKNKIQEIEGISNLTKLRRLDVQSNRLLEVVNLSSQVDTLEELYLAHNGIDDDGAMCETGLALPFTKLETLDLSRNRLTSCEPFAHLASLDSLWLSGNNIATFEEGLGPLSPLGNGDNACLEEIYLEHNPIYEDAEYREKVKEMLPSLKQIDATRLDGGYGCVGGAYTTNENGIVLDQARLWQQQAIAKAQLEAEMNTNSKVVTGIMKKS